uniref:NADH-ubiquinone oxidoreductase chain 5 n=1 Tax=Plectrocnemia tsukuiensis TaxID=623670 RepID=A0A9E8LNM9_9NEOP|nr:NADH dehydrogenase subunit 5 [Plectrocnemia tsukuiensis]UZZ43700.1 NADH dehydrogenase subunit 5 [Plectrocnemia tsukuiensis]
MNMFKVMFIYLFFISLNFFLLSLFFFMYNLIIIIEWFLIDLNSSNMLFLMLLDFKSLMFMSIVLFISSMIMLYSDIYMENEIFKIRFIYLVLMFILSMVLMILSPNLISIMLGWDGLGLTSFCLVIYYQNKKSLNSGMLTLLMNRVGDVMILISIVWMMNFGSWNFYYYLNFMSLDMNMFIVTMFIMLASITKSAQIPYSSWLPAAMAAPTPISALVHSSTLVTAGIYLMIRFSHSFYYSYLYMMLFFLSLMTMFMAGISANFEFNLKKIIALSTLSQLGLMMSVLSLGLVDMSFFHLLSHALFKSMLFMCAGMFIHVMSNNQDIRKMGNLINIMPITCSNFLIGNLSLSGIPFMAGFYSKDLLMEKMIFLGYNWVYFFIYFFSLGLTMMYSVRLMFFMMLSDLNYLIINFIIDNSQVSLSMMNLMIFSIIGGSILNWLIFFNLEFMYLSFIYKFYIYFFMLLGIFMGSFIFKLKIKNFYFFMNMFFSTLLFSYGINYFFLLINHNLSKYLDMGWLEEVGSFNFQKNIIIMIRFNQIYFFILMILFLMMLMMYFIFLLFFL